MICWSLVGRSVLTERTNYWKLRTSAASSVSHGQELCSRTIYPRFDLIRRSISAADFIGTMNNRFLPRPRKVELKSLRNAVAVAKISQVSVNNCKCLRSLYSKSWRIAIQSDTKIFRHWQRSTISRCEWNFSSDAYVAEMLHYLSTAWRAPCWMPLTVRNPR